MALSLDTQVERPPSRSSGLCAVCLRSMPLRKDGAVRVHGPVMCRCPGSGKRPRGAPPDMSPGPTASQPSLCSQHPTAPSASPGVSLLPRIRLLKRLPLASHDHAASKLSSVLEEVNRSNNVSAWIRLLNFPRRCFQVPGRGGRRWNLARLVNQQVAEENDPTPPVTPDPSVTHPQRRANKSQSATTPQGSDQQFCQVWRQEVASSPHGFHQPGAVREHASAGAASLFWSDLNRTEHEGWRSVPHCCWLYPSTYGGKSGRQDCPGAYGIAIGTTPAWIRNASGGGGGSPLCQGLPPPPHPGPCPP